MNFAKIKIKNPVFIASGVAGFAEEHSGLIEFNKLGGFITKTITLKPREDNPPPRIIETPQGIVNRIGLENLGIEQFIKQKLPVLRKLIKVPLIISIGGEDKKDYIEMVKMLNKESGIAGIELNLSCPNVNFKMISQFPEITYDTAAKIRAITDLPLIAKLTPAVSDITKIALSCKEGGLDGVALVNTYPAIVYTKNGEAITGGLSGPCIKPIVLKLVSDVAKNVDIDIMGVGGICSFQDANEFFKAGAKAIAIGSAIFHDPKLPLRIISKLKRRSNYQK